MTVDVMQMMIIYCDFLCDLDEAFESKDNIALELKKHLTEVYSSTSSYSIILSSSSSPPPPPSSS